MTTKNLVQMANQVVASFFASCPKAEAIDSAANLLKRFWDPRMRREIERRLKVKASAGLSHIAMEAANRVVQKDAAKKSA